MYPWQQVKYTRMYLTSVQFCPLIQWVGGMGEGGDMRDNSAEIFLQSFLQEALVSSSVMRRDVHSFMLSIQLYSDLPKA